MPIAVKSVALNVPLSVILTIALEADTLLNGVTSAAVTSDIVPEIFTAEVTVTVPPVMLPIALNVVALIVALALSAIVTRTLVPATTLVESVTKAAVISSAAPVIMGILEAVTVPPVAPPMALNKVATVDVLSEIDTVAVAATTLVASVTNEAVTSDTEPLIAIAFVTVTVFEVFPPIALKFVAAIGVVSISLNVIATLLTSEVTTEVTTPKLIPFELALLVITSVTNLTSATEPEIELNPLASISLTVDASIAFKEDAAAVVPATMIV